jgi:hypothetical protein
MVTKPLVFESTLSVVSKLLRSCLLELFVVALLVLRIFVSVLASENFLSNLQKRAQEAALSELVGNMSPTAIFNRNLGRIYCHYFYDK